MPDSVKSRDVMIKFDNVRFKYEDTGKNVLNGVSFEVRRGEFVAVLGRNGSGKSTLAGHMNAMLLPSEGRVSVLGMDTADETSTLDIRQNVGAVFQNPDNQLVATVVEEDVAFAPENLGVEPEEIRRRVDDALSAVGMEKYKLHAPHTLSGGQKQRVAIAGALAMQPGCIVLDEPTAMLDPKGRHEVMEIIKKLNRENGTTVILITHYMEEATLADRVIVVDNGSIVLSGTPREVFSHADRMRRAGLDVPQSTELAGLLAGEGLDLASDIIDAEECAQEISNLFKGLMK